jgi:hypothetical protein
LLQSSYVFEDKQKYKHFGEEEDFNKSKPTHVQRAERKRAPQRVAAQSGFASFLVQAIAAAVFQLGCFFIRNSRIKGRLPQSSVLFVMDD